MGYGSSTPGREPGLSRRPRRHSGDLYVCPSHPAWSVGTFAVLSLMTGSAVERMVPEPLGGNRSGIETEQLDAQRVGAAAALAFGSGALMVREDPGDPSWGPGERMEHVSGSGLGCRNARRSQRIALRVVCSSSCGDCASSPPQLGMFALQLGVLSTFLSEPVVKALTSGAALHVLVSQLPSLLGLPLPRQIGCFALFKVGMGGEPRREASSGLGKREPEEEGPTSGGIVCDRGGAKEVRTERLQ